MTDDVLRRLYDAATDADQATLDDLVIRAGLVWKCASCGWRNVADNKRCEECDSVPEHEWVT